MERIVVDGTGVTSIQKIPSLNLPGHVFSRYPSITRCRGNIGFLFHFR